MMQLLVRSDVSDFDAWKSAFDDDAEARMHAGLTLLQIWREGSGAAWCLFTLNVPEKARAWAEAERSVAEFHLLETL